MSLRDRLLSETIDGTEAQALVKSLFHWHDPYPPKDRLFLAPEINDLDALTTKYVATPSIEYGGCRKNKEESHPDCDDFVLVARGQVALACVRLRLPYRVNFFGIEYEAEGGEAHDMCFAFDRYRHLWLFEPQTGKWFDGLSTIKKVRRVAW